MDREDIKMFMLHCENMYILKMLCAKDDLIERLEQRWKDNEQDISSGNRVFEQKLKGNPIAVAEIEDAFKTVGIIIRAKIERLCNEGKYEEAQELEKALIKINTADYNH